MSLTENQVREVLRGVVDPEIHMSIVDLGLIYGVSLEPVEVTKVKVAIQMTLTTPACPYGPALLSKVHSELSALPEVAEVDVQLVWSPPWDPRTMASEEARLQMGLFTLDDEEEPSPAAPTMKA